MSADIIKRGLARWREVRDQIRAEPWSHESAAKARRARDYLAQMRPQFVAAADQLREIGVDIDVSELLGEIESMERDLDARAGD
jgi:hypothetical protein